MLFIAFKIISYFIFWTHILLKEILLRNTMFGFEFNFLSFTSRSCFCSLVVLLEYSTAV